MSDDSPKNSASNDRPRASKSATAFRTISEVAGELDLPQHVLRFWETKFPQVRPLKRGGGRRYYRPEDIQLLQRIRDLLYVDGYTIKGVQKLLRHSGSVRNFVTETEPRVPLGSGTMSEQDTAVPPPGLGTATGMETPDDGNWRRHVEEIVADLEGLRAQLLESAG